MRDEGSGDRTEGGRETEGRGRGWEKEKWKNK